MEDHLGISEIKCINPGCWNDWKGPFKYFHEQDLCSYMNVKLYYENNSVFVLFQPRERGRLRFHMLQNVQIALDFLRYRKVSHTVYCSWLFAIHEGESHCILLLISCDTRRWVILHIALDFLRYKKVSHTVYCSWLFAIHEGESHCILLLISCDTGRWVILHIVLDLRYRNVSQTTLLLTCDTGRWVRLYIAHDFLRYRKVSQTLHCSWLAIQEGEPDCILLSTSCDTGRWVRLNCSWLLAIQESESG